MEEYNLHDLTSGSNGTTEQKYLCVILWQKKPFELSNIILSHHAQEIIDMMDDIDDCTISCCKKLPKHITTQEAKERDTKIPQSFEDKWHGYYICMFSCNPENRYAMVKEKIKYVNNVFAYDPWFDTNKMGCIQFRLLYKKV